MPSELRRLLICTGLLAGFCIVVAPVVGKPNDPLKLPVVEIL